MRAMHVLLLLFGGLLPDRIDQARNDAWPILIVRLYIGIFLQFFMPLRA